MPARVRAEARFGVHVDEPVEKARSVLEEAVREACLAHPWLAEHPASVEWWDGQFAPCATEAGAAIVETALGVAGSLGRGPGHPVGVPYGSDLRLLVNDGATPGVLFGPGDVRGAHREDESIAIDELVDGARAVALTVLRYLC